MLPAETYTIYVFEHGNQFWHKNLPDRDPIAIGLCLLSLSYLYVKLKRQFNHRTQTDKQTSRRTDRRTDNAKTRLKT